MSFDPNSPPTKHSSVRPPRLLEEEPQSGYTICRVQSPGRSSHMKLKLAHYRNRFSMFRTYYALRAGLVKTDGLSFTIVEVPDPPSRELEEVPTRQGRELEAVLTRGGVDISNVYLPIFLERRLAAAPIIGLCTEWKST